MSRVGVAQRKDRLLVIGLESAEPSLVFDAWRGDLPNLQGLMDEGIWGRLESSDPPLSVIAWSCAMSGRDPGEMGVYGLRNRAGRSYQDPLPVTGEHILPERLWQTLSARGRRCAVLGVPGTYPPSPLNGVMVSFALPNGSHSTFPPELETEVERIAGGYVADVPLSPVQDRDRLLRELRAMTQKHFSVARHFLGLEGWDLFVLVEAGTDRVQRGFWRFFDRDHRHYLPGSRFQSAVHDYYVEVDAEIGRLVDWAASVLVISGHGARRLLGGVRINQWLIDAGYLRLYDPPAPPGRLSLEDVDWASTRAWGEGESCGQVFLNVEGREPRGCVREEEYERLRDEIAAALEGMEDPFGRPLGTTVHRPERIYRAVRSVAPDLLVYFGDLAWRSVGSLGEGDVLTTESEGAEDVHCAREGIFIYRGPEVGLSARGKERAGISIYDLAPTLFKKFGLLPPADLRGRALF